ncbi:MAG TPA: prolipoprotein diacylglyceryl transferase [Micropepsaceae bacterium]|nr:prolipoprotein diacylglyceryl transferase [Micropepsaceae bacterium]
MIEAVLPYPNIDPVLVHIYGPISIRWYALSYIAGLLLGWGYVVNLLRTPKLWAGRPFMGKPPATPDDIGDLFVWVTLGVIIGGRLGFVLLYGVLYCGFAGQGAPACFGLPQAYLDNPLKIVAAWEGGMSFHGGLIGVVIAILLFCRSRKLQLLAISDLIAAATPIGLFFGRIANFINGELWGKITDVPWAMVFPNAAPRGIPRHPSQIYEALMEGVLLFLILRLLILRFQVHRKPGFVVAWFLTFYGVFRFIAEFFRDSESKLYDWFSMGQALSLPMWVAAAFFFWWASRETAHAKP